MFRRLMNRLTVIGRQDPLAGGKLVGRGKTHDVAFTYRMGAGFAGDVNRTHPANIEPALLDPGTPVLGYGLAVLPGSSNGVRQIGTADTGTRVYGVSVRPYPTQQLSGSMAVAIGAATPPVQGVIDVLRLGYIMAPVWGTPKKGDPAYVRIAAGLTGSRPQGGFEATTSTDVVLASNMFFNGPPDATGVGEVTIGL